MFCSTEELKNYVKKILYMFGDCKYRIFSFAHLICEKISLHIVLLYSRASEMAAITRPDAKQESN